jgi:hypothetical protein
MRLSAILPPNKRSMTTPFHINALACSRDPEKRAAMSAGPSETAKPRFPNCFVTGNQWVNPLDIDVEHTDTLRQRTGWVSGFMVAPASRIHQIRNGMHQLNNLSPSPTILSRTQWISGNAVRIRPMTSFFLTVMPDSLKISFRPTDGSSHRTAQVPPIKHPLALGAAASRVSVPQDWGKKKEKNSCLTYVLSGIASG